MKIGYQRERAHTTKQENLAMNMAILQTEMENWDGFVVMTGCPLNRKASELKQKQQKTK